MSYIPLHAYVIITNTEHIHCSRSFTYYGRLITNTTDKLRHNLKLSMHHADSNTGTTSKHTSPSNEWFRERI